MIHLRERPSRLICLARILARTASWRPSWLCLSVQNHLPATFQACLSGQNLFQRPCIAGLSFCPKPPSSDLPGLSFLPRPPSGDLVGLSFWPQSLPATLQTCPKPPSGDLTGLSFWPKSPSSDLPGLSFYQNNPLATFWFQACLSVQNHKACLSAQHHHLATFQTHLATIQAFLVGHDHILATFLACLTGELSVAFVGKISIVFHMHDRPDMRTSS